MEFDIEKIIINTSIAIILLIIGLIITRSDKAKIDNGNYTNYGCLGIICIVFALFSLIPLLVWIFTLISSIMKFTLYIIILLFIIGLVFVGLNYVMKKIKR